MITTTVYLHFLELSGTAKRVDINRLLLDKLPDVLDAPKRIIRSKTCYRP